MLCAEEMSCKTFSERVGGGGDGGSGCGDYGCGCSGGSGGGGGVGDGMRRRCATFALMNNNNHTPGQRAQL